MYYSVQYDVQRCPGGVGTRKWRHMRNHVPVVTDAAVASADAASRRKSAAMRIEATVEGGKLY